MSLAIVIPAYKDTFLNMTLESLSWQTNKNFKVYIGNDSSPYDLESIVNKYRAVLNIRYVRFPDNMGGKDLVAQWERCISLTCDEEWIWLFSDDDYLSPDCVDSFYQAVSMYPRYDVYRFNVQVVGREQNLLKKVVYPPVISSYDLYRGKLLGRLDCYVVEFIFSRKVYEEQGGFQPFDLAWGSDLATWIKFGVEKGIRSLEGGVVSWRSSGENISTIESPEIVRRKVKALIAFLQWGESFWKKRERDVRMINDYGFIRRMMQFASTISAREFRTIVSKYTANKVLRTAVIMLLSRLGIFIKKIKG